MGPRPERTNTIIAWGERRNADWANRLVAAGAVAYTWIETSETRSVALILLFSAALSAQSGGAVVSGRVLPCFGFMR